MSLFPHDPRAVTPARRFAYLRPQLLAWRCSRSACVLDLLGRAHPRAHAAADFLI